MTTGVVGAILSFVTTTRLSRFDEIIEEFGGGSQADLARKCEIPPKHIGVLMTRLRRDPNGAGLDGVTLGKIMRACGINPCWLLFGDEPRRIDVASGDPELISFLARLPDDLKAAADRERLRVSEAKALIGMLDRRELRPYSTREGGGIDWSQAIEHHRRGIFRPSSEQPSTEGVATARREQGTLPKKIRFTRRK